MNDSITIIGLGLMGRALADTLAAAGVATTVWNRTPRPQAVRPEATVADSLPAAIAASPTVIICVADTPAVQAILGGEHGTLDLSGRDVINLTTGMPDDAIELADIATAAGASYLDGIIAAFPESIGEPATQIVYAGDEAAWTRNQETLLLLGGGSFWTGRSLREPAVLDIAVALNFYHAAFGAFLASAHYAISNDVSAENLMRVLAPALTTMEGHMQLALDQICSADFSTDQATIDVHLAAVETARDAMGSDGSMLNPLIAYLERAQRAGDGNQAFAAMTKHTAADTAS